MLQQLDPQLTSLTLLGGLGVAALVALILPFVLSRLKHPRALGTRPRPDLYSPKGTLPFLGNQLRVLSMQERQPELWVEMVQERKRDGVKDPARAVSDTVIGRRFVAMTRPEHLEWIQKTNFKNYVKGPIAFAVMGQVLGKGIFTSDGDLWYRQRKATAAIFHNSSYRGNISTSIARSLDDFLEVMRHIADTGDEIKLSKVFFSLTLDTFCEMAFSTKPGALLGEKDGRSVPFAVAFDYTQLVMSRRFQQPFWPSIELLDGTSAKMKSAVAIVHSYANDLVEKRQNEIAAKVARGDMIGDEDGMSDLLTMFLKIRDEKGHGLDKDTLRDAVINLLIAGRDTSAAALAWCCFHLLSHPELIEGVRKEAALLADNAQPGKLEYDQLKEMQWTTACWYETTRLHPAVPASFWQALSDDQIPNGPRIEKGDLVAWSDWASSRDPDLWGKDAGAFNPERWIDKQGKFRKESEFLAHAFNGGRRRCLGETLATFEGVSTLLLLFANFDLAFAPGYLEETEMLKTELCACETPRYQSALTLPMLEPLRVVIKKRAVDAA
ncbi:hypothetical protein JCM10213_008367 [Rhodosporidiobolus nylandii]